MTIGNICTLRSGHPGPCKALPLGKSNDKRYNKWMCKKTVVPSPIKEK
jgi:hypothetical protein